MDTLHEMTQTQTELAQSRLTVIREATGLRDQMNRLIARLEAGGDASGLDVLGSRPSQFDSAVTENAILARMCVRMEDIQMAHNEALLNATFGEETEPRRPAVSALGKSERYEQFRNDMADAGFAVRDYDGRCFYHGPAVAVEDDAEMQDVIRATEIPVQHDDLGKGFIVYPR